mgnify:CR=1 FL=1
MSIIELTTENFDSEVTASDKRVVIDFYAVWCGPCKMLSPVIDEIAEEREDIKICKVNVDEQPELAARFGVMSIPTVAVLEKGAVINISVGFKPKEELLELIDG